MARTCHVGGQAAELVTVRLTRHQVNRLKALAKGLGWPRKMRQVALNTVFSFGLDAGEELLEDRKFEASKGRS